jgi:cobalt-zinc-cadmium efflux system membrane fusion protein
MWCKEHSLYEDECHLCHPEVNKESAEAKNENSESADSCSSDSCSDSPGLFCKEHNVPEVECGICQPDLAKSLLPGDEMKVRFVSEDSANKAGIQTNFPQISELAPVIESFCELQYNLNTMAKVTPLVGGVIRSVNKDIGDTVQAGEPLVELHSAEVATAKSKYLSAIVEADIQQQALQRETRLQKQNVTSEKELIEAQASYRMSKISVSNLRQRLQNLGLTVEDIKNVEQQEDTSARLIIYAPFSGTLIQRDSVIGEAVDSGHAFFTLADLSTRWLEISVPSDHVGQIKIGQSVEAVFSEFPNKKVLGFITWIDTSIDPETRMIRVRALVSEKASALTAGLFGKVYIATGEKRIAAVVPKESVQRHEGLDYVFVKDSADLFALRRVNLGNSMDGDVQVLEGLDSKDSVVTDGSFIVMSEFLKSRLGAGCVDD